MPRRPRPDERPEPSRAEPRPGARRRRRRDEPQPADRTDGGIDPGGAPEAADPADGGAADGGAVKGGAPTGGAPTGGAPGAADLIGDSFEPGGGLDPGGGIDPWDPIDLPLDILQYRAMFAALDPALPLALLPVRLETLFTRERGYDELLVRIHPDVIHADGHDEGLTADEQALGRAFWRRTWRAGGDVGDLDVAFSWLAEQVGPWRAAWVARSMAPRNAKEAPAAPVPDDVPLDPPPRFPNRPERVGSRPVYARLLPSRWVVVAFWPSEPVGTWYSEAVAEPLAMAPGLADVDAGESADGGEPDGGLDAEGMLSAQGLDWVRDVDAAEDAGMLVRVDLREAGRRDFTELIVFGIQPDADPPDLAALLDAHRYTHGLDLVGQGTPTNTTATAAAPWHPSRPDLATLRESELGEADSDPRPEVVAEGDLLRLGGADAASVALGLRGANALDRALHAGLTELADAEGMTRALWPATLGQWFRSVLAGVVDGDNRTWLRDWATTFVRGGGPLPTLLVGEQPYGLLPVTRTTPEQFPESRIQHVEAVLDDVAVHWDAVVEDVDRLDPGLSDAPPDGSSEGDLAAMVSRIVGAVPHPLAFRLRSVDTMREEYNETFGGRQFRVGLDALAFPDEDGVPYGSADGNWAYGVWDRMIQDLGDAETLGMQVDAVEDAAEIYGTTGGVGDGDGNTTWFTDDQVDHIREMGAFIEAELVPLLQAHDPRSAPLMTKPSLDDSTVTGMMGDDDDPHAFFNFHAEEGDETTWDAPLVAEDGQGPEELVVWLTDLRDRAADGTGSTGAFDTTRPLLQHLLDRSVGQCLDDGDGELVAAGLDRLIEVATTDPEAIATLERLMREALGLATNRVDAWFTGLASWRLDAKRQQRARGLHLGAWGAVVDLRPRAGRPSQGHVLAPSLSHATTAAVLRSGWSAFGGTADTAGLAVDLSSDRVRRAQWIVDGVRRGQDLADLLGARFERRLHERALDRWVRPFREVVLAAVGDDLAPNAVVDGLVLARAHGGGPELSAAEQSLASTLPAWLSDPAQPSGDPGAVLDDLVADLDAAADATAAQGVFALVEGNLPEANATLTAAGSGEVDFPALRVIDTPRPAATIQHRLVAFVDPEATSHWPGAATGGRSLASPGLEAWLASLLPDPASVSFRAAFEGSAVAVSGTLAEVPLAALDVVFLAPAGEDPSLGRLGAILAAWAEGRRPADATPDVPASIHADVGAPLHDLLVVARTLRALVAPARDLDDRSLSDAGGEEVPSGVDLADLRRRVRGVAANLSARADDLDAASGGDPATADVDEVRGAMVALVGHRFATGNPAELDPNALWSGARRMHEEATGRLAAAATLLDGPDPDEPAPGGTPSRPGPDDRRRDLEDALEVLVGHTMPWTPRFATRDPAAVAANLDRRRLPSSEAVVGWLAAAGRVDPGAQRLRIAIDLVEALADDSRFSFGLVQWPDHRSEGWAAIQVPEADGRGRTCLVATGALPRANGGLAGIVAATWTEAIPVDRQTPGLAFHFDAPSTQAPQAVLLCVTTSSEGFSVEVVRDTIAQTLQLARRRMVGLDILQGLGQYLPATYLPGDLDAGVAP